ncbi:hypothetical protein [Pelagibaculum spongiae]|nr:hypothetical protein [Pelagibaculum spongiae]
MSGSWGAEEALHRQLLMQQQASIPRIVLPAQQTSSGAIEIFKQWMLSGNSIKFTVTTDGFFIFN